MSDLIVTLEGIKPPPEACAQEPPHQPVKTTPPEDRCHIDLPLVDPKKPKKGTKILRFDRQGKSFVLSNKNSSQNLTWITQYKDWKDIFTVVRLVENIYRSFGEAKQSSEHSTIVMVSQFVVNGKIRFPKDSQFQKKLYRSGDKLDLSHYLLAVFTISPPGGVQKFVGALTEFRRDGALNDAARKRVDWVTSIFDLVPKHKAFRKNFIGKTKAEPWRDLSEDLKEKLRPIFYLSRKAVTHHWMGRSLKLDREVFKAFQGYQKLHPKWDASGQAKNFCTALQKSLEELGVKGIKGNKFHPLCRRALKYMGKKPEEGIRASLWDHLTASESLKRLQDLIKKESKQANMSLQWLHGRGRIEAMAKHVLDNLKINLQPKNKTKVEIKVDVQSMIQGMGLSISSTVSTRREYILSSLAILRFYFGQLGSLPDLNIFWEGEYKRIPWSLGAEDLKEIRSYQKKLESQLRFSHKKSDQWLPLAEGISCAVGSVGILGFETRGNHDSNSHRSFGLGSYTLAGAGCGALAGHFILPMIAKGRVRNRYFWDGASGVGGALLGAGIYFLVHTVINPYQDPSRNPVDEYGP